MSFDPTGIGNALLTSESDAILAADTDGVIRFWNPGAERIFGHPATEVVGRSMDVIIPEKLRAPHWAGWTRTIHTGQSRYGAGELLSVPAITADGRRISVEFTITLMCGGNGQVTGVVATLRDVTERFTELRDLRRRLAASAVE